MCLEPERWEGCNGLAGLRALYFGRFQPFHNGHLYALKWLLERYDEVIILIGMASESHTYRNPFTAGERAEMIESVINWLGIDWRRVKIASMPTLEVYSGFSLYVLHMFPRVDCVATANGSVASAFKHAGVKVVMPPLLEREKLRGEYIRMLIARGVKDWEDLVPLPVREFLIRIRAPERLRQIIG